MKLKELTVPHDKDERQNMHRRGQVKIDECKAACEEAAAKLAPPKWVENGANEKGSSGCCYFGDLGYLGMHRYPYDVAAKKYDTTAISTYEYDTGCWFVGEESSRKAKSSKTDLDWTYGMACEGPPPTEPPPEPDGGSSDDPNAPSAADHPREYNGVQVSAAAECVVGFCKGGVGGACTQSQACLFDDECGLFHLCHNFKCEKRCSVWTRLVEQSGTEEKTWKMVSCGEGERCDARKDENGETYKFEVCVSAKLGGAWGSSAREVCLPEGGCIAQAGLGDFCGQDDYACLQGMYCSQSKCVDGRAENEECGLWRW